MTTRTHDVVRLIAVVLNIPATVVGLYYAVALVEAPFRRWWSFEAAITICLSLPPVFALIAIMGKSAPERN